MKVRDVMTTEIHPCHPEDTLAEAITWMWKSEHNLLPVVDWEGHVVGQISDEDVRMALNGTTRTAAEVQVSEAMVRNFTKCSPKGSVNDALRVMHEKSLRQLLVVNDDDDTLAGILDADVSNSLSEDAVHK